MFSVKQQVVTALQANTSSLPVYYELFVDSKTSIPCITYMENQNNDNVVGNTIGYSDIGFTIKIWATKVSDIDSVAINIDSIMRNLGFKRTSANELTYNDQVQKVLMYQALGKETY